MREARSLELSAQAREVFDQLEETLRVARAVLARSRKLTAEIERAWGGDDRGDDTTPPTRR